MSAAAAGAVPESHLVLKYNAVVGRDPFPPIAELARQLGLRQDDALQLGKQKDTCNVGRGECAIEFHYCRLRSRSY